MNADAVQKRMSDYFDRLMRSGLSSFSDFEIAEMLISLAQKNVNENETRIHAHNLLAENGGYIGSVIFQDDAALKKMGLRQNEIFGLKLVREMIVRGVDSRMMSMVRLDGSRDVYDLMVKQLGHLKNEVFRAILMDNKNRAMSIEKIADGSSNQAFVNLPAMFKTCCLKGAEAVVCVHNHPAGDPTPSGMDNDFTKQLVTLGEVCSIRVMDHVITGHTNYYSYADHLLIEKFRAMAHGVIGG